MLSASFAKWVATLDATERQRVNAMTPAKRNETLREFFANRSSEGTK